MVFRSKILPSLAFLLAAPGLFAGEIFVSPSGDDAAPGTAAAPVASLREAAARVASSRASAPGEPVTVTLADGVYFLGGKPVELTAAHSGTPGHPVLWRAASGARPVVHAGRSLGVLDWKPVPGRPGVWQAVVPEGPRFEQLFQNGRRLTLARYPNATPGVVPFEGATDKFDPERAKRWTITDGVYVHGITNNHWGSVHYRITGVDTATGDIRWEGGWQMNRPAPAKARFVEGLDEELDAPGEWFHRAADRTLLLMPADGGAPPAGGWSVDGADIAFALRGEAKAPAHDIALCGLRFTGTARTFMETREPLLLGDWCVARKAAVLLAGTERCSVSDSAFTGIGGNAVLFSGYNRDGVVERCEVSDAGAGGVNFVGSPSSVRDPRFRYGEPLDSAGADRTPGPAGPDYAKDCRVSDCLMHDLGLWEKQVAGVHISMASGIVAERNTIHRVPRAAINVNDGTWGGHRIEGNDAWDTVRETGDHGSFNSWGRDRFWQLDGVWNEARGDKLALVKSFAKLDAVTPVVLRGNRFDCRHGWGIDLDDGSSNYLIENNLVTAGGIKLREGFFRTVRNNTVVGDTLHPHVWYWESGDSVTGNIFGKTGYDNIQADIAKSGGVIDRNLFCGPAASRSLDEARKAGTDRSSLVGDPRFVSPASGDYRVAADSPAFALGFVNFPMDFGTRVPAYARVAGAARASYLAENPISGAREKALATGALWGARVSEIDLGLRSAAGLPDDDGLYLLAVPAGSPAAKLGLSPMMVLRAVNGSRVLRLAPTLEKLRGLRSGDPLELRVQDPAKQVEIVLRGVVP